MHWRDTNFADVFRNFKEQEMFNDFMEFLKEGYSQINNEEAFDEYLNENFDFSEINSMFSGIPVAETFQEFDSSGYQQEMENYLEESESTIIICDEYSTVCYWVDDVADAIEKFTENSDIKLERIKELIKTFCFRYPDCARKVEIQSIRKILGI